VIFQQEHHVQTIRLLSLSAAALITAGQVWIFAAETASAANSRTARRFIRASSTVDRNTFAVGNTSVELRSLERRAAAARLGGGMPPPVALRQLFDDVQ
jgi:hypothetical protein